MSGDKPSCCGRGREGVGLVLEDSPEGTGLPRVMADLKARADARERAVRELEQLVARLAGDVDRMTARVAVLEALVEGLGERGLG